MASDHENLSVVTLGTGLPIEKKRGAMQLSVRQLTDKEFKRYSAIVYAECGILLTDEKRQLLNSRLSKRLRKLGVQADAYIHIIEQNPDERRRFVDAISTNHTFFFRESKSFRLIDETCKHIWCAAASSGEEPYSLAAYCYSRSIQVSIWATDISSTCLDKARRGIYPISAKNNIPGDILKKCFQKGRNRWEGLMRVRPAIKAMVRFEWVNLLDGKLPGQVFDMIFCRNVMIYFDRPTKEKVVRNLAPVLKPKGYFIIGGAESLNGLAHPFKYVEPSVYMQQ
jgi:chemotaxis protein methyltransferase CheR